MVIEFKIRVLFNLLVVEIEIRICWMNIIKPPWPGWLIFCMEFAETAGRQSSGTALPVEPGKYLIKFDQKKH